MSDPGHDDIAARRRRLGMTQRQFGDLLGIDQSQISRIEAGRGGADDADRLRRALAMLERQRDQGARAEAAAFWAEAARAPHAEAVVTRLAEVAEELLDGPLSRVSLGLSVLDCLPGAVRDDLRRRGRL